jgi:hypothetical protein
MLCLLAIAISWHCYSHGGEIAMDFNDDEDSFLDIVSKGLVIFMMILAAFLLSWVFGKI